MAETLKIGSSEANIVRVVHVFLKRISQTDFSNGILKRFGGGQVLYEELEQWRVAETHKIEVADTHPEEKQVNHCGVGVGLGVGYFLSRRASVGSLPIQKQVSQIPPIKSLYIHLFKGMPQS